MRKRRTIKFIIALTIGKIIFNTIKIIKPNRGSHTPGEIAIKICPNFLSRIRIPKTIIAVTGTNGKTTVANLLSNILNQNKYQTIINSKGSNTDAGVATALIQKVDFFGNCHHHFGIFELDERLAHRVFAHIEPTYLVCTNLFRDSIKRNGHFEFVFNKLNPAIPNKTTLILNADDLISSSLQPKNKRIYFSVENVLNHEQKNIVQDISTCPKCHYFLEYKYRHHHHIGKAFCPKCSFKSPTSDFTCIEINKTTLTIKEKTTDQYPLIANNIYNIYNTTAIIATLKTIGLTKEQIANGLNQSTLIENRQKSYQKNNLEVLTILSKNQNPISTSLALDYIANLEGNKVIVLLVTDTLDKIHGSEDISWLYDTDFEFLNKPNIKQIIACGNRCYDISTRLQLAGIKKSIITTKENYFAIKRVIKKNKINKIIIAYELYGYNIALDLKNKIIGDQND